jgi:hypothetical protein
MRDQQDALKHDQQDIEQRLARLVAAIETGGEAASLVAKVKELEARRVAIAGELHSFRPVPRLRPEVVEGRLTEWRRPLRQSTTQGRAVLQRVVQGRSDRSRRPLRRRRSRLTPGASDVSTAEVPSAAPANWRQPTMAALSA